MMLNLAKILFAQSKQRRPVKLGIPADVIIRMWMKLFPIFVAPNLLRVIFRILIDRLGAPVLLFSRHIRASFDQQYSLAALRKAISQRPASCAGADDNHVEMVVHNSR